MKNYQYTINYVSSSILSVLFISTVIVNVSGFPLLPVGPTHYQTTTSPWGIVGSGTAPCGYEGCNSVGFFFRPNGANCKLQRRQNRRRNKNVKLALGMIVTEIVEADDGEALQELFSKFCDNDGLMTKNAVKAVPAISELLQDEDLLPDELSKIWDAAPKFPEIDPSSQNEDRIDVDSFMQIYRDVDDLFEGDDDSAENSDVKGDTLPFTTSTDNTSAKNTKTESAAAPTDVEDSIMSNDEKELELAFKTICDDAGLISKNDLRKWSEIDDLVQESMLGEDEFEILWERTSKSPGSTDTLDVDGFLSFNVALDDLFVEEDDEMISSPPATLSMKDSPMIVGDDLPPGVIFSLLANEKDSLVGMDDLQKWQELASIVDEGELLATELLDIFENAPKASGTSDKLDEEGFTVLYNVIDDLFDEEVDEPVKIKPMVTGDDLPPAVIFSQLANDDFLVEMDDLKRWRELVSWLEEGELLDTELQNLFEMAPKALGTSDKLDEDGFTSLYNTIDDLFEEEEDEAPVPSKKAELFNLLAKFDENEEMLSCGLEISEQEQAKVLDLVTILETEPNNKLLTMGGNVAVTDLSGSWDLLYTSSGMMRFNKGLSGLGSSFPNGKFGGLRQNLIATKYITDIEYTERINVTPDASSFDVVVNGDWELKSSVSLLTGLPSTIMAVEPDKVVYGPTTTRADHWKSVRAMNLLDLSYLDEDLRVMRGNTSTDTLFIFKRGA